MVEILVPTLILLAIGALRGIVKPTKYQQRIPSYFEEASSFASFYSPPKCFTANLLWSCDEKFPCPISWTPESCQRRVIAIAPESTNANTVKAASDFFSWAKTWEIENDLESDQQTFQLFQSQSALNNYISSSSYGLGKGNSIISAAVIFSAGYPSWGYTIRMNQSYVDQNGFDKDIPYTSEPNIDISLRSATDYTDSGQPYAEAYMISGQLPLSDLVNSYVASATCKIANKCSSDQFVVLNTTGTAGFPSEAAVVNGFWGLVGGIVFSLFMILSLLYPIANVIRSLVFEKESKLREGMAMMAMRGDALWASWSFHNLCLFLPLSIILTVVGRNLFVYSDPSLVWMYFFVFFLASVSFGYFIATLFNKSLTAAIIGCLAFLGGWIIFVGMASNGKLSRGAIMAASLHPACAFCFGTLGESLNVHTLVSIIFISPTIDTSNDL